MLSENSTCILKWIAVGKCILLLSKPVLEKISGTKSKKVTLIISMLSSAYWWRKTFREVFYKTFLISIIIRQITLIVNSGPDLTELIGAVC